MRPPVARRLHPVGGDIEKRGRGRDDARGDAGPVDEYLERGAGLPARLDGAVELVAGGETAPPHHCANSPSSGIDRHQRPFGPSGRLEPFRAFSELPQRLARSAVPEQQRKEVHAVGKLVSQLGVQRGELPRVGPAGCLLFCVERGAGGVERPQHVPVVGGGDPVLCREALRHHPVRRNLEAKIERRVHLHAAAVHLFRTVSAEQLLAHVLGEVRGKVLFPVPDAQRRITGLQLSKVVAPVRVEPGELGGCDEARVNHPQQHLTAARVRCGRVSKRRGPVGGGGHRGENCRLRHVEAVGRGVEVKPGGRIDAVAAVPEVDEIQVHFEYLRLGVALLVLLRDEKLHYLAPEGALSLCVRVLDELLRDGGAPLPELARKQVHHQRPYDRFQIVADVQVEIAVLGCNERRADMPRKPVDAYEAAVFIVELRYQFAVHVVQARGEPRLAGPDVPKERVALIVDCAEVQKRGENDQRGEDVRGPPDQTLHVPCRLLW